MDEEGGAMADQGDQGTGGAPPPPPPTGDPSSGWTPPPQAGEMPPPAAQWPPPGVGSTPQSAPPAGQQWQPGGPPRTNGYALVSLILGIAGFVVIPLLGHVLALVFGYIGKGQIDRSGGVEEGRGMAVAGIILGWIGVGLSVLVIIGVIIAVAVAATHGVHIIINGTPVTISPG